MSAHAGDPGQAGTVGTMATPQPSDDDPYLSEDAAFLSAVRSGDASCVRSSYADAFRTYELTWAIRRAGEAK